MIKNGILLKNWKSHGKTTLIIEPGELFTHAAVFRGSPLLYSLSTPRIKPCHCRVTFIQFSEIHFQTKQISLMKLKPRQHPFQIVSSFPENRIQIPATSATQTYADPYVQKT